MKVDHGTQKKVDKNNSAKAPLANRNVFTTLADRDTSASVEKNSPAAPINGVVQASADEDAPAETKNDASSPVDQDVPALAN